MIIVLTVLTITIAIITIFGTLYDGKVKGADFFRWFGIFMIFPTLLAWILIGASADRDGVVLDQIRHIRIKIQLHKEMDVRIIDVDFLAKVDELNDNIERTKKNNHGFFDALYNDNLAEEELLVLPGREE